MKLLIVAPDFPYPPNHGGRVDIWQRITLLKSLGHEVDLIATTNSAISENDLAQVRNHTNSITIVRRKNSLLHLLSLTPYQITSRANLSKLKIEKQYDCTVLESESVSPVIRALKTKKLFLRIHNNEATYFQSLMKSTNNVLLKFFYFRESALYPKASKSIKCQSDKILHISKDEFEADELASKQKSVFLPSHVSPDSFIPPQIIELKTVIFVGNLFTENNIAGLEWFVKEVHPLLTVKERTYKLLIAGNTRGRKLHFLEGIENIEFVDSPAELDSYYKRSSVFINPMLDGAGVKLKTINAIQQGLPVVSTTTGSEGIGLTDKVHFLLANTEQDFADAVISLLQNPEFRLSISVAAQKYIKSNFNAKAIYQKLFR